MGRPADPLSEARRLVVRYRLGRYRYLTALAGVSLAIQRGEALALVGESGSGKTTLALTLLRALAPRAGRVFFDGVDITDWDERQLRPLRRRMQMVFQDPGASLDPQMTVRQVLAEALELASPHGGGSAAVTGLLDSVGLPVQAALRRPHQLSGGQRQRVAIARALALSPELLVADEPVSALDASTQAQIVMLLDELRRRRRLTVLLIAHDLALVSQVSDRVAVMYLGQVVEVGPARSVVFRPQHPYTAVLLSATPDPDPRLERRRLVPRGEAPSPLRPPSGCRFHPRCPIAREICAQEPPPLREVRRGQWAACHFAGEVEPPVALTPSSAT